MIHTGNTEIDAVIAELITQVVALSESNAAKAGTIATLRIKIAEQSKQMESKAELPST